jgi:succinyl-CoA:(S)-malate CoA-transferase subunit A/succinyl-CoA:(S)-malate CoA-transferase subunit B
MSGASQKPFERLMESIGHPEMNADPRFQSNEARIKAPHRRIINRVISEWVGNRDLDDVIETCERLGITIGPIASMQDIAANPHFAERGSILRVADPASGEILKIPNLSFRLTGTPGRIRFPGLPLGSANEFIYGTLLGRSSEQIAELEDKGVI